ncbi:MAG: hypothetical protein OXG37_08495 [Actinomycetia bacterium]|nr:hypothetical protein [Actinomycetes bacterium]
MSLDLHRARLKANEDVGERPRKHIPTVEATTSRISSRALGLCCEIVPSHAHDSALVPCRARGNARLEEHIVARSTARNASGVCASPPLPDRPSAG